METQVQSGPGDGSTGGSGLYCRPPSQSFGTIPCENPKELSHAPVSYPLSSSVGRPTS